MTETVFSWSDASVAAPGTVKSVQYNDLVYDTPSRCNVNKLNFAVLTVKIAWASAIHCLGRKWLPLGCRPSWHLMDMGEEWVCRHSERRLMCIRKAGVTSDD